jgi:hypothetical protein
LKATVISKQAQFDKAEVQFHSTEKLETEAEKRSNEASRLLSKFETRFNQEKQFYLIEFFQLKYLA